MKLQPDSLENLKIIYLHNLDYYHEFYYSLVIVLTYIVNENENFKRKG